mmetsp:Transcript_54986/g.134552  ORF Transcript_54986/g.134552 Transcript_54986/m.134552 type:complete len:218 (+) Transcript_54986:487-1140(+)
MQHWRPCAWLRYLACWVHSLRVSFLSPLGNCSLLRKVGISGFQFAREHREDLLLLSDPLQKNRPHQAHSEIRGGIGRQRVYDLLACKILTTQSPCFDPCCLVDRLSVVVVALSNLIPQHVRIAHVHPTAHPHPPKYLLGSAIPEPPFPATFRCSICVHQCAVGLCEQLFWPVRLQQGRLNLVADFYRRLRTLACYHEAIPDGFDLVCFVLEDYLSDD